MMSVQGIAMFLLRSIAQRFKPPKGGSLGDDADGVDEALPKEEAFRVSLWASGFRLCPCCENIDCIRPQDAQREAEGADDELADDVRLSGFKDFSCEHCGWRARFEWEQRQCGGDCMFTEPARGRWHVAYPGTVDKARSLMELAERRASQRATTDV